MDWMNVFGMVGMVVTVASAVVNMTPTQSDNKVLDFVIKTLDVFALNWVNRNKPTE